MGTGVGSRSLINNVTVKSTEFWQEKIVERGKRTYSQKKRAFGEQIRSDPLPTGYSMELAVELNGKTLRCQSDNSWLIKSLAQIPEDTPLYIRGFWSAHARERIFNLEEVGKALERS